MFSKQLVVLALIFLAPLVNTALASEESNKRTVAVTVNDSPVLEVSRSENGRVSYELSNDWLLGMSMGISPISLAASNSITERATHFDLYESRQSSSKETVQIPAADIDKISWFWTFGSTQDYAVEGAASSGIYDVQLDILSRFSLQTKAGFVVPFGKKWLFGGGVLIERGIGDYLPAVMPGTEPDKWETTLGTFFGLKFSY